MRQKKGFVLRDICGDKAILGEGLGAVDFGKIISLNETAAFLWEKASELGDFTAEQLAEALCSEYDVETERALNDVRKMLDTWQENGIIES